MTNFKTVLEAEQNLLRAVGTGFIDSTRTSHGDVQPRLIYNDVKNKHSVLGALKDELNACRNFWFAVAFLNKDGLAALKLQLREAANRGVKGRFLTTNYLSFNAPNALRELLKLKNVEVRVFEDQLHVKGYYFDYGYHKNLIVGSANLTETALSKNKEWNLRISSMDKGAVIQAANKDFEDMWEASKPLTEDWITSYEPYYEATKRIIKAAKVVPMMTAKLAPNSMQTEALHSLEDLRSKGADKALLISATGTGKTYLSAFDVREYDPKRVLFLAHREQLLKQAEKSYKHVMADTRTTGILGGSNCNHDEVSKADFVFATIQTISKDEHLYRFSPADFDYIVVDEVHHAGAKTYQKVMGHFKPKFILGMTATPERSDDFDIYKLFNYNIAYEIRLQRALEENLLCPFHYYGIEDITVDDEVIDDASQFNQLTSSERVKHVLEQAEYYGASGDRIKGLVFCNTNEVAKTLAQKFTEKGYPSIALSGANSQDEREQAISRLVADVNDTNKGEVLNYIFTVDIFNEGVDIPEVNQVIMLRPTESAIVFVQQLGRGLRKNQSKRYVVIIDFIGNYKKSFLIPIALSGDRTYNKDNIRRYVAQGSKFLPGLSSVNLSAITQKRIYDAIDQSNWTETKLLKGAYEELKKVIGHIPYIKDFDEHGTMDITNYFEKFGSYYNFLVKYEKDFTVRFTEQQEQMMNFVCKRLAKGKRPYDLEILKTLLNEARTTFEASPLLIDNVYKMLSNQYTVNKDVAERNKYTVFVEVAQKTADSITFIKSDYFKEALEDINFKNMLDEVLDYGLERNQLEFPVTKDGLQLVLYKKYTYEEVCAGLLWPNNVNAQNIGGYKYDATTNTFPVFINYHKSEDISDSINYEDRFISETDLIALSKSNRTLESVDIKRLQDMPGNGMKVFLFIRKNNSDEGSKEFYYFGTMKPMDYEEVIMEGGSKAVEIHYKLDNPVPNDLYEYITKG